MAFRPAPAAVAAACLLLTQTGLAAALDIAPHRAIYKMSLASSGQSSGVIAADGKMSFQWGDACDGWTVEQHYTLHMQYAEDPETDLVSDFVTWESKDGTRYRFLERKRRNGEVEDDISGEASLAGKGKGGTARFTKPDDKVMKLAPGVLFPTAHTLLLLKRAAAGENFVAEHVFDGASEDNAVLVTAVIGSPLAPDAGPKDTSVKSPLLDHRSWRMRLAFFPPDPQEEKPDYELGMRLLENGVSREMVLDYGDFSIKARLDQLEALPKPKC